MVIDKSIPKATAKRLSLYYRIFKRFHADQVEKPVLNKLQMQWELTLLLYAVTFLILENWGVVGLAMMLPN